MRLSTAFSRRMGGVALLGLLLTASAPVQNSTPTALASGELQLRVVDHTLFLSGAIPNDPNLQQRFRALLDGQGVRVIHLNSVGGDAMTGLAMGQLIAERPIDVVVDFLCASSCANYLFLAGRHKTVEVGALLGFHGDPLDVPAFSAMPGLADYLAAYRTRAARFYSVIHVNRVLLDYSVRFTQAHLVQVWSPDQRELACAGVTHLTLWHSDRLEDYSLWSALGRDREHIAGFSGPHSEFLTHFCPVVKPAAR